MAARGLPNCRAPLVVLRRMNSDNAGRLLTDVPT
jgi:hypothetical protein